MLVRWDVLLPLSHGHAPYLLHDDKISRRNVFHKEVSIKGVEGDRKDVRL